MKLISMWEPWASLLATGAKKIETRGWSTLYRGHVAIHATKGGLTKLDLKETCAESFFAEALRSAPPFSPGHIIAVGTLLDCRPLDEHHVNNVFRIHPGLETPQELAFGNYGPEWFGLVFEDVKLLRNPVPFKSRQGKLLDLDAATERAVEAAL